MRGSLYIKAGAILILASQCSAYDTDDMTSLMQMKSKMSMGQPYGIAPAELMAPPEGGLFSAFYNNHTTGRGIHKWLQYFPAYQHHFAQFIGKEVHIMEIGVQSGGSLDMWKSVFGPQAHVYGVDIDKDCKLYEDANTKIFIGDQGSPEFWEKVKKEVPRIDILIDDGAHLPSTQIGTLGLMLDSLSPNGIYVTEDIHGTDNKFWSMLQMNNLQTQENPPMFHFEGTGRDLNSVHIYPFLAIFEKKGNAGPENMLRQLGVTSLDEVPKDTRTAVMRSAAPEKESKRMQMSLAQVLPGDLWKDERITSSKDNMEILLNGLMPKSWLLVRDGDSDSSYEDAWDDKADSFLLKVVNDFKGFHEGNCCDWRANVMQQGVDSLHIYPHLLVAKRAGGALRLVKAPPHGTSWIPYDPKAYGMKGEKPITQAAILAAALVHQ